MLSTLDIIDLCHAFLFPESTGSGALTLYLLEAVDCPTVDRPVKVWEMLDKRFGAMLRIRGRSVGAEAQRSLVFISIEDHVVRSDASPYDRY
jgi:hypothetical protein